MLIQATSQTIAVILQPEEAQALLDLMGLHKCPEILFDLSKGLEDFCWGDYDFGPDESL